MHTATQRSLLLESRDNTASGGGRGVAVRPRPLQKLFFSRPSPWTVINFMSKISKFELLLSFWLQIQGSWLRPEHSREGYAMNIFIFSLFVFLVLNYFHENMWCMLLYNLWGTSSCLQWTLLFECLMAYVAIFEITRQCPFI